MRRILSLLLLATAAAGCDQKSGAQLAPTATALAPAKPKAEGALTFAIDKASSKVAFAMDAPKEKITGRVHGAAQGDLLVDVTDVTKTTGLITLDLGGIELYQALAGADGSFGQETKSEKQNEHARTWLEISPDAPEADRKKNARVDFSISSIESASEKDIRKLSGAERKVTLVAQGELLLHGHKSPKKVELEAVFKMEGDKPTSVTVKTVKPFKVGLAEHDVKPREAFGKLAQSTLEILAPKVAKEAEVTLELTAAAGATAPAKAAPAASSAAPAESAAPK
jgi:hypothetical protein